MKVYEDYEVARDDEFSWNWSESEPEPFWIQWLRKKKVLGGYDKDSAWPGWVSEQNKKFMWKFVIPVLHKLRWLKWEIAYTENSNTEDEIHFGYKYLRGLNSSYRNKIPLSSIEIKDLEYFKRAFSDKHNQSFIEPRVIELTDEYISLEPPSYMCPSCGWEPWEPEHFWLVWYCHVPWYNEGISYDHMGVCRSWEEEWFCLRCWDIFSYNSGDC